MSHRQQSQRRILRAVGAIAAIGVLAAGVAACGDSGSAGGKGSKTVNVGFAEQGCSPANLKATAGPTTFEIKNDGGGSMTEMEVLDGALILGERENVTAGLTSKFSLNLKPGKYDISCNDGSDHDATGKLVVTGTPSSPKSNPRLEKAVAGYDTYVKSQVAILVKRTDQFAAAVDAGDMAKAKALYETTRIPYERIEPVAETFGDLDPRIDARINDVAQGDEWTGFHPIERALWQRDTLTGTKPLAAGLVKDVAELESKVANADYQPAQLANGAVGLLNEVSQSKITGEEERYSHTDLTDFKANVDGARKAFELLKPDLSRRDAKLSDEVSNRFDALDKALEPYRASGDVYVNYAKVTKAQRRKLSQAVDALAQPLAQVGGKIVG